MVGILKRGSGQMLDKETSRPKHSQNFAQVHFETRSGEAIMEPMKIFREIGEDYQIATPVLNGYVLVKSPSETTRQMTKKPVEIHLVYAKIGSLSVYHGLSDVTGERITLSNGKKPDQVKPVQLEDIAEHRYYPMTDDGIGEQLESPEHYQPTDPTVNISLVSLTSSEKRRVEEMEAEFTAEDEVTSDQHAASIERDQYEESAERHHDDSAVKRNNHDENRYITRQSHNEHGTSSKRTTTKQEPSHNVATK